MRLRGIRSIGLLATACAFGCGGGRGKGAQALPSESQAGASSVPPAAVGLAAAAPAAFAAGTLGFVLNQFMDRASQLLAQFEGMGLVLEVQAGGQAVAVIGYAKAAYEDSLNKTVSSLSAQQQQFVADVRGLLDDIEKRTFADLNGVVGRAQAIANTLPLSNRYPQVTKYSGNAVNSTGTEPVEFAVEGNFYDIGTVGYEAKLTIAGKTFQNITKTSNRIVFQLPRSAFSSFPGRVAYADAVLEIPHKEKCKIVFDCDSRSHFRFSFVQLPPSPGKVNFLVTMMVPQRQTEDRTSHSFQQDSSQDDKDGMHCENIEPGWLLDTNSVAYHFSREEGKKDKDWFDNGNKSSPTAACWAFKTLHKGTGTSGKLTFTLSYKRFRDVSVSQTNSQELVVAWGDSKVVNYPASATWKLVFSQFDGRSFEFASSDASNPYLRVVGTGNAVTVKAAPF